MTGTFVGYQPLLLAPSSGWLHGDSWLLYPPTLLLKDEKSVSIKLRIVNLKLFSSLSLTSSFSMIFGKYNKVPLHISPP